MFENVLSESLLQEVEKSTSVIMTTLKNLGLMTHGTLTWGAGIGAFIGPVKDLLGDQALEVGTENVVLLATALAAGMLGKTVEGLQEKIAEKGLEGELETLKGKIENTAFEKAKTGLKKIAANAAAVVNDTYDIATFTAFFTPVVDYISSLTGATEIASPTAAAALISGAIGAELIKNVAKKLMSKKKKKEDNKMKIDELRQMIKEALQEKSFLLASPLTEAKEEDEPVVTYDPNEGRMAKAQLYKLMNYAHYLHDILHDDMDLPEWVESKITKACDYIGAVKHHLEYEFYRTGTPFEVDQNEKIPREATLDMLKGLAQRTSCPKTSKALMDVLHKLETDPQHQQDRPMEEEEQY